MSGESEKRRKAIAWAEEVVSYVDNDPRPIVKCKESRPITDIKDLLVSSTKCMGTTLHICRSGTEKENMSLLPTRKSSPM